MWKTVDVVMLATEKATGLWYLGEKLHYSITQKVRENNEGRHIYLVSDEEIKDNDWVIDKESNLAQYTKGDIFTKPALIYPDGRFKYIRDTDKKIIATTDPDLHRAKWKSGGYEPQTPYQEIVDAVPKLSPDFVRAYVDAQGKIDKVQVEVWSDLDKGGYPTGTTLSYVGTPKVRANGTVIVQPVKRDEKADIQAMCRCAALACFVDPDQFRTGIIFDKDKFDKWFDKQFYKA